MRFMSPLIIGFSEYDFLQILQILLFYLLFLQFLGVVKPMVAILAQAVRMVHFVFVLTLPGLCHRACMVITRVTHVLGPVFLRKVITHKHVVEWLQDVLEVCNIFGAKVDFYPAIRVIELFEEP